jgi:hypothetical protein
MVGAARRKARRPRTINHYGGGGSLYGGGRIMGRGPNSMVNGGGLWWMAMAIAMVTHLWWMAMVSATIPYGYGYHAHELMSTQPYLPQYVTIGCCNVTALYTVHPYRMKPVHNENKTGPMVSHADRGAHRP